MCKHEKLKCTSNVFYCLECGVALPDPQAVKDEGGQQKPVEAPKTARKRKAAKADK